MSCLDPTLPCVVVGLYELHELPRPNSAVHITRLSRLFPVVSCQSGTHISRTSRETADTAANILELSCTRNCSKLLVQLLMQESMNLHEILSTQLSSECDIKGLQSLLTCYLASDLTLLLTFILNLNLGC